MTSRKRVPGADPHSASRQILLPPLLKLGRELIIECVVARGADAHVQPQNWICRPIMFQALHLEATEKILPTLEVSLEGGHQKRLAKWRGRLKKA